MWIFKNSRSIFSIMTSIVASVTLKIRETTQIDLASLCCFRIIFCIFTILFGWHSYLWITTVPDALFSVDSLLKTAPGFEQERHKGTADSSFLGILIAFGFLTAGWAKAFSWIDFDLTTSGFLSWFYSGYFFCPIFLLGNFPSSLSGRR